MSKMATGQPLENTQQSCDRLCILSRVVLTAATRLETICAMKLISKLVCTGYDVVTFAFCHQCPKLQHIRFTCKIIFYSFEPPARQLHSSQGLNQVYHPPFCPKLDPATNQLHLRLAQFSVPNSLPLPRAQWYE